MSSRVVKRPRNLETNPRLLSPPEIVQPLYQCATSVTVRSYAADAKIEVDVDGAVVTAAGGISYPDGVTLALPAPLVAGQKVKARQRTATGVSPFTAVVIVRDHTADYPAGPPRPQINPAPVYKCGVRTGVSNLLPGGNVRITADAVEVGAVKGCSDHQGVNVSPAYGLGQKVIALFDLCNDPSPPSLEHITLNPPAPLPALSIDPIIDGQRTVTVRGMINGAKVTLMRGGALAGTYAGWGGTLIIDTGVPFAGETVTVTQAMCPGDPPSPPTTVTTQPCSTIPPPAVGPVQAGDKQIVLTQFLVDATIKVFVNGVMAGASGGPIVNLNVTLAKGDKVIVLQDLDKCQAQTALEITVACIDPPISGDPSALDLFPVGNSEYSQGDTKGSVYYPAQVDGKDQPFNKRLAALGRVPIVFMAHGNHSPADPSYLGYDYFQRDLAKMGIIAVSIDCNALNGFGGGVGNIEDRADLIISNIAHFQSLDSDPASVLHGKIDFARTGLMGHSRGGDAVVLVPTVIGLPGVTILAVLSLAPTNFRFWFGLPTIVPKGYAFMTILPAGDGDVVDNNGAQFYDQAVPGPYKSQIYAHFTNHNFFNRQWLDDDSLFTPPQPAVLPRVEHERILTVYGCALYRNALLGHATLAYLNGQVKPAGVLVQNIYTAFETEPKVAVDHHEDGNGIGVNSLGQPTAQTAGLVANEFPFGQGVAGFNGSFYGMTTGMVVQGRRRGLFRTQLKSPINLAKREIWCRCAEVTDGATVAPPGTGFELGLEDSSGQRVFVDASDVGGLPRPYPRDPGRIKTMLSTVRFRGGCFQGAEFDIKRVVAILIRLTASQAQPIAFDDMQIY